MAKVVNPGGTLMGHKMPTKYAESELVKRHREFLRTHKKGTRTTKQILQGTDYKPKQLSSAEAAGVKIGYGSKK